LGKGEFDEIGEKIPFTYTYFFLWAAQNLDFPDAEFLHLFPSFVFAAHATFFSVAIFPPFKRIFELSIS
jgi:hypothetical protein